MQQMITSGGDGATSKSKDNLRGPGSNLNEVTSLETQELNTKKAISSAN